MATEKLVYSVLICRSDGNHIVVIESNNYDRCYDMWKQMQEKWALASKEQVPFLLEDPVVTAFAPPMIFEIKLVPVMTEEMASKSHNPYQRKMTEQGFGKTFPSASGTDLLAR
jgi:hypothetical protein